ncbi:MAG: hypothetical protein D6B27_08290 [Gammaproteobacteria bacterium]|nr:MAG: hypothetical protein D6B27_08290 [Gammaproteobacteria bacterium]
MGQFTEDRKYWYLFANYFVVECPVCKGPAEILPKVDWVSKKMLSTQRKLLCSSCGYFEQSRPKSIMRMNIDCDWVFGYPLFLKADCCGKELVAYNIEHLNYLRSIVAGKQRSRRKNSEYGWSNGSVLSRLPSWIKAAKNREKILKVIDRLTCRVHKYS